MVKKIIISVLFITLSGNVLSNSMSCEIFADSLTNSQLEVLQRSYAYGLPYGIEYSLTAIALEESSAGLNLLNYKDPSAGIHQIYASTALTRENLSQNHFNRNRILLELATSEKKSTAHAISELVDWTKSRNSWTDVWASYNGGPDFRGTDAQDYAKKIKEKVKLLKSCSYLLKISSFSDLDLTVFDEVERLSGNTPKYDIYEAWKRIQ